MSKRKLDFKKLTRIATITWLGSICLFFVILLIPLITDNQLESDTLGEKIMQVDVMTGIFAFLAIFVFALIDWILKAKIIKKIKKHKNVKQLAVILFLLFLLPATALAKSAIRKAQENKASPQVQLKPSPKIIASPSPKILGTQQNKPVNQNPNSGNLECVGPDGKHFKTTEAECKKLNESWGKPTNYMVNCNVSSKCGGGTRYMEKSACNNTVCCQIGDNWIFYKDKANCNADQRRNQPSYNFSTYTYSPLPFPSYEPITYPSYQPTYEYNSPTYDVYIVPQETVEDCQQDVIEQYRSMMIVQYGCYFPCPETGDCGNTSVCEVLWRQFQQEYDKCN